MKRLAQLIIGFVGLLVFMSIPTQAVSKITGAAPVVAFTAVLALAVVLPLFTKKRAGFGCDVQVEIWVKYIIDRLYKDNGFLKLFYNDDQYVVGGKIVHIPQPGARPTVVKNRSIFPATAVRRTDTDVTYTLDEYTTDPTHIQDAEKVELSYDKISSVFGDHAGYLAQDVADDFIYKILNGIGASQILVTSGAATAGTAPSATGNRKALVHDDLRAAMTKMNVDNVLKNDRYALLPSNMLDQLISSLSQSQYRDFSQYMDAKTGTIGKLYGFNIIDRSAVSVASSANAAKAPNAVGAATDNEAALIWQKDAAARALGEVKFFEKINDPQFYGDVYSALLRMGGRRRRADDKGVIQLTQAASA